MKITDGFICSFAFWDGGPGWSEVKTIHEANGLIFQCPKCERSHAILVWFVGVPQKPNLVGPGRWSVAGGSGLADLTLHPSIQILGAGCGWHGYIRNGETVDA